MDPVAIAIFAFIAVTALAFLYYAFQGESEDSFEKVGVFTFYYISIFDW